MNFVHKFAYSIACNFLIPDNYSETPFMRILAQSWAILDNNTCNDYINLNYRDKEIYHHIFITIPNKVNSIQNGLAVFIRFQSQVNP